MRVLSIAKLKSRVEQLSIWAKAHPGRAKGAAAVLLLLLAGATVLIWYPIFGWRSYDVPALGLSLDLPKRPVLTATARSAPVYECRTRETAIVLASVEHGDSVVVPNTGTIVSRAMQLLHSQDGVTDLAYEVTRARIDGKPALKVSGHFKRDATLCRVLGYFVNVQARTSHVLCFYSDSDGAAVVERVLASVRVLWVDGAENEG